MDTHAPSAMPQDSPPQPTDTRGFEVRSEHSGDFLRLARLWDKRTHFSLIFAACDNPLYRDGLIKQLAAVRPGMCLELQATDTPDDWLVHLQAATQAGARRVHTLLPQSPADAPRWWQRVNGLRERLADAFPAPLLLWLSDADIETAAHQAPDLWNWREAVFSFTHVAPFVLPVLPSDRFSATEGAAEAQRVRQRLEDIQSYLQRHTGDPLASAHLRLEAAQAHERLGQWTESEHAARLAATAFRMAGNDLLAAQAMGQIADVYQARGQLDEALRIRQQEELPVYERLGDVLSKAVTMGKIADVLEARGQLDEALTHWQADCLPVFDLMGLQEEKALALQRIKRLKALQPNTAP